MPSCHDTFFCGPLAEIASGLRDYACLLFVFLHCGVVISAFAFGFTVTIKAG